MDSNDFSANGGQHPPPPPPNHHHYHGDPGYADYPPPPPNNANYPGYMSYQNYSNYPPSGPNDLPPPNYPPPHAYQQDPYQHHQYQQPDPAYHYLPPEPIKVQEPVYQHPPPNPPPPLHPPHVPEEPKHEPPKEEAPVPAIPAIPATAPEQPEEVNKPLEEPIQQVTDVGVLASQPEELPEGPVFNFDDALAELQTFKDQHGNAGIPVTHSAFSRIMESLIANGIENEVSKKWEHKYALLKAYKEKNGDCDVPFTDAALGDWVNAMRSMYKEGKADPLNKFRIDKLNEIGFEWEPTKWDNRLEELIEYKREKGHVDVPINYPSLGIWVVNQRFNLADMPKERVEALDSLGFIWNHNRKHRSDEAWKKQYNTLLEYIKEHNHCNVPTTAGHSKLSKWVGKQREEYKKFVNKQSSQLSKYRIDKLNEVGFQWSLQQWTVIPWEDRFEVRYFLFTSFIDCNSNLPIVGTYHTLLSLLLINMI